MKSERIKRGMLIFHKKGSYIDFVLEPNKEVYEVFYIDIDDENRNIQYVGFGEYPNEIRIDEKYYHNGEKL